VGNEREVTWRQQADEQRKQGTGGEGGVYVYCIAFVNFVSRGGENDGGDDVPVV
jgi:hypothetical protein